MVPERSAAEQARGAFIGGVVEWSRYRWVGCLCIGVRRVLQVDAYFSDCDFARNGYALGRERAGELPSLNLKNRNLPRPCPRASLDEMNPNLTCQGCLRR